MEAEVNWLAILLATVASMIIGSVWYARSVFGDVWIKLAKINEKNMGEGATRAIAIAVVMSAITAYVLAHFTYISHAFFQNSFLQDALSTAFWAWLGFTAVRIITHDVFENRPNRLTLLTVMHELVIFLAMGLIIGLLPPSGV